ncbi:VOC family protein [Actinacidiphila glaucinigra]|uniref:Glyoxylase I family protein n=1 Tax=Actinacidiphila glaucinigra TaxID=235986 RepID=A0A239MTP8_9ACTN|nr:VOC family protein [Actinacidiphila glaucinigra]SNT45860.1 glyoxylase I family protein [Actinacidiphila glaucinigra]
MPIPGLTRVDHFGITVPDLDQAREFFEDVLGFEYLYRLGPLRDDEGHWMSEHLNVHDRAVSPRIYFFRIGGQAVLEVFEYQAPDQRLDPPRNSDVGGHHLALYVDDMDTAVADLRRRGLRVLGEPTDSKGPHEGQRWVYFLSPWGLQCELVSYPHGKAFFRNTEAFK